MLKKLTFAFLGLALVISSFGAVIAPVAATTIADGSVIKVAGNSALYLVSGTTTRVFPHEAVYKSWGYRTDWETLPTGYITTVTQTELDSYTAGLPVPFRAGVTFTSNGSGAALAGFTQNAVFVAGEDGAIHPIESAAVYASLYPSDWSTLTKIPSSFLEKFTNFKVGSVVTSATATYVDGSLLSMGGNVYVVDAGVAKKITVATATTAKLYANGEWIMPLVPVTAGDITVGADAVATDVATTVPTWVATVVAGSLTASLSASTAPAADVLQNEVGVPFTTVTLTAGADPVTVTGLNVSRTDYGAYGDFDALYVAVDGVRHGNYRALNSSDTVSLNFGTSNEEVIIAANGSKDFTVYGNMASSGGKNKIKVTGITTTGGATVSGLPVEGNRMSFVTTNAPVAEVTDGSFSTATVNIGDKQTTVGGLKIKNTNSSEDISFRGVTFKSVAPTGTSRTKISNGDISNFTLYYNGDAVSSAVNMTSGGSINIVLTTPITIEKGGSKSKTFELRADIDDGAGKYFLADLYDYKTNYTSEVDLIGLTNNARTYTDASGYTVASGVNDVEIAASDLAVAVDSVNNPATRTVLDNQTVTLLKGYITAGKGSVTITGDTITLTSTSYAAAQYENLKLYVDGSLVSEVGSEANGANALTDEFTVDGKVPFEITIDANDITSDTIKASFQITAATRDSDGVGLVSLGGSATGNIVTFGSAGLTITRSSTPVSVSRVAGSKDVEFLGFTLATGTAGAARVTGMTFEFVGTGATLASADVQNVRLYDATGTTQIAGPVTLNASKNAVFTGLNLNIASGATTKYVLKGDLNSTLTSSLTAIDATMTEAGNGSDGTENVTNIIAYDVDGDQISVNSGTTGYNINASSQTSISVVSRGTLDVELSTATPKTHQVMANTPGDNNTIFRFTAGYEDVKIKKLVFTTAGTTDNDDDIAKVTLKQGTTVLKESNAISSGVVTFNFTSDEYINVPAGGNATLTLVTDYNSTVDSVADSGATIRWTIDSFATDVEAIGAGSNQDIYVAPKTYNGTGVALTSGATTTTAEAADAVFAATDTVLTVALSTGIDVGNILLLDENGSGYTAGTDEYVLVLAVAGNNLTLRRGVGGSTATHITDASTVTEYSQKLAGNTSVLYSNFPVISAPTQPTGSLTVGDKEAFKFTLTSQATGEEDVRLEEVKIKVTGAGIDDATAGTGWYISSASLYNGSALVGSAVIGDAGEIAAPGDQIDASGEYIQFLALDGDVNSVISSSGTTFTVKVTVALSGGASPSIGTTDTLQLSINSFGSASAAGGITNGDLDWEDQEAPTVQVEWIDTVMTQLQGNMYWGS